MKAVLPLLAVIVMAAALIIFVPFGDGAVPASVGYASGPQHTIGPMRDLPLLAQFTLGILLSIGGVFTGGQALANIFLYKRDEALSAALVPVGALFTLVGLMTLIGALVAL
jgi:hypothetical protein